MVYAVALTTGTHWPRLVIGPAEFAWLDKLLHALAFGGLGFLLAMTGWIRRTSTLALVLIAWAALDEATQPLFQRHLTWTDLAASLTGVALVVAGHAVITRSRS